MSKKLLSERDICTKFISPAIERAGWNRQTQYLEEVSFTDGKIYVKGRLTTRWVFQRKWPRVSLLKCHPVSLHGGRLFRSKLAALIT
ncbi:hypothetical protein SAMN04488024_1061 [Pedobacter soli]|uniref:Type I restriction enzyme, R subunit n=1 Tax=Pedobacter soli TaxID=390242 RepID=A0A1G6V5G3_9SPHI|nr:hypothetical protein SAMN04488024_1061 [Pedobacter soli]